ncbi:SRPBCC domain-containing protein [Agromyces sp. Marseille-P2726]|uniref:SRPBCC domain-containing protein n=1 Tax=Agromyces sp. Marseille-P2726 TaxID=2709132 RepID=UPI00156F255B|nr:SRPBCC domain-containing protein [Agromyces sp. Marseille-P2726]
MPTTITTGIRIDAPADAVWATLTDTSLFREWNPFVTEIHGRLALGERLRVRIAPPGGAAMTFRPRITRFIPGRQLAWLGSFGVRGIFDGEHSFTIEPIGAHACRFTHAETFRGVLVPLMRGALARTESGFELMNAALRDRVETVVPVR